MLDYKLSKQALRSPRKIEKSDNKLAKRIDQKILQLRQGETKAAVLQGASAYSKQRVGKYRTISTIKNNIFLGLHH